MFCCLIHNNTITIIALNTLLYTRIVEKSYMYDVVIKDAVLKNLSAGSILILRSIYANLEYELILSINEKFIYVFYENRIIKYSISYIRLLLKTQYCSVLVK
jgi:hypothetical protein